MINTEGRILKSNDVKFEGQIHLDAGKGGMDLPRQTIAASSAPQVRISENHTDYAVLEVICSCGSRISVRCEYADAPASASNNNQT